MKINNERNKYKYLSFRNSFIGNLFNDKSAFDHSITIAVTIFVFILFTALQIAAQEAKKKDDNLIRGQRIKTPKVQQAATGDTISVKDDAGNILMTITDEGTAGSIKLNDVGAVTPSANKLYNNGGSLYWNGSALGSGGGTTAINDLTDAKSLGNSIFFGSGAGANDDGSDNRNYAIGINAIGSTTTGVSNAAIGYNTLFYNTTGNYNIGLGQGALFYNNTGSGNVAVGYHSNHFNQAGSNNTILGHQAGRGSATHNKSGNVFIGYQAGYFETSDNKLYIENTSSSTPLIWGDFTVDSIKINGNFHVTGNITSSGSGLGATQIKDLIDAKYDGSSLFLGQGSGINDDGTANGNTAVGYSTLFSNTVGFDNTASGYSALYSNTTGFFNTAIGYNALSSNISGEANTANGVSALRANTTGAYNTATGALSLYSNTTGAKNTSIGSNGLRFNTTGIENTSLGFSALYNNTTGNYNVAIGFDADRNNYQGSKNTIVGYQAGKNYSNNSKSGNVFLGYKAGYFETTNNKLYINNDSSSSPLIWGDFAVDIIKINGKLEVLNKTTVPQLQITNGAALGYVLTSDANGNASWLANSASGGSDNDWTISGNNIYSTQSGNVGIGVLNPSTKLDVNGKIKTNQFQISTGANNGYVLTSDASGNATWQVNNSQDNDWDVYMNNMVSIPTGNIGIGTTTPSGKLHIVGKTITTQFQIPTGATDGYVLTSDVNGNASWQASFSGTDNDWTITGTEIYHFGNVGIGTQSPISTLSVGGAGNSYATIYGETSSSNGYGLNGITRASGNSVGVYGSVLGAGANSSSVAVYGKHTNGGVGVKGQSTGITGIAILGTRPSTTGLAGRFEGPVEITGKLSVGANPTNMAYQLAVDGAAAKSSGGSSWAVASDIRLKNLLGKYKKGLSEIEKLSTVKFRYKENNPLNLSNDEVEYGFVAQEVQKIFPEAVHKGNSGYLDFNMHVINVAMVNAVQELSANKNILEQRIEKLEKENQNLKAVIDENKNIRNEIDIIKAALTKLVKEQAHVELSSK